MVEIAPRAGQRNLPGRHTLVRCRLKGTCASPPVRRRSSGCSGILRYHPPPELFISALRSGRFWKVMAIRVSLVLCGGGQEDIAELVIC